MPRTATARTRTRRPRTGTGIVPDEPRWKGWLSITFAVLYLALCAVIALDLDVGIGSRVIPAAEVAADLPGPATCVDDLLAEVGATVECTVHDGPTVHRVRATVTTVDGDDVEYDFQETNLPGSS